MINRVVHIKRKIKNAGGRQRDNFLSLNWTLTAPHNSATLSTSTLTPVEDVASLSKRVKSLENQLQASTRVLREIQPTPKRPKRTAKHYSKRHTRLKKQRVEEYAAALSGLENDGLTPVSVTVFNTETEKLENITVRKDLETALQLNGEELGEQEADLVSMMLYVKDKYNISGSAYHELASLCREMPRHYRLKQ